MIQEGGPVCPFNFDNILKHRNVLQSKKFAHIANETLKKKPIERLEFENDNDNESSEGKSIPKLEFFEYYQINGAGTANHGTGTTRRTLNTAATSAKSTSSSSSPHPPRQTSQQTPLRKQQIVAAAVARPDLSFRTADFYRSYLNYASTNPFESTYDVVTASSPPGGGGGSAVNNISNNKKQRSSAEWTTDSSYTRFNRAASSLSLLSRSIECKKFSANVAAAATVTAAAAAKKNSLPSTTSNRPLLLLNESTNALVASDESARSAAAINRQLGLTRKNSARNTIKAASMTTTTNQFLNYRNDESLAGSSQYMKKTKETKPGSSTSNTTTKQRGQQQAEDIKTGSNGGPEAYLDMNKLDQIRKWVDEVNRVQSKSGKWGETINKILFYD